MQKQCIKSRAYSIIDRRLILTLPILFTATDSSSTLNEKEITVHDTICTCYCEIQTTRYMKHKRIEREKKAAGSERVERGEYHTEVRIDTRRHTFHTREHVHAYHYIHIHIHI